MGEQKIDAIYIESGTTMYYFTGMRWGQSERMFALVIPQQGEIAWVCPKFEEERARELIKIGANDIRTWEEDLCLNDTTTTESYTPSLHDALPISPCCGI